MEDRGSRPAEPVRGRSRLGWALWLGVLCVGCVAPSATERDQLRDQVRGYHDDMRWRRYGEAAQYLPQPRRKRFLEQVDDLKDDLEIADYELVSVTTKAEGRVQVRVAFDWESKRTGLLRRTEVVEVWVRAAGSWMLAESHHAKGEKLPFLDGDSGEK